MSEPISPYFRGTLYNGFKLLNMFNVCAFFRVPKSTSNFGVFKFITDYEVAGMTSDPLATQEAV